MALVIPLAVGLLCGTVWLQAQAALPDPTTSAALAGGGALLLALAWLRPLRGTWPAVLVLSGAMIFGAGVAALRAEARLADRLAPALEGTDLRLQGQIIEMPRRTDHGLSFTFATHQPPPGVPTRIQLGWYHARSTPVPDLHAGESWALTVRLKRPHGSLNPHGSDREAMLLAQGIGATGYVRDVAQATRLPEAAWAPAIAVERVRQSIRGRFERALPDSPWRGVLIALAVGDQDAVSAAQWALFSRSGITHLVSISGLHVTVWALLAGALVGGLWRRVPWLVLRMPAQSVAAAFGVLAAAGYVALAGAAVPAVRSLIMLAVVALATQGGRTVRPMPALAAALASVLLWDPWCVLSKGTWLSFAAVGVLLWAAMPAQRRDPAWRRWLLAQWAIGLGLLPILLALTGQVSLVAPFSNLIAVPVVTFVLLPIEFAFVIFDWAPLLQFAAWLFDLLARGLGWLAAPQWAVWQQAAAPASLVLAASLAALWSLAPRGVPGRGAALAIVLALLCWRPERPPAGQFDLVMLDVGQGLALHVRTAKHDLLFDAGPRFGFSCDAGQRIVLPYLRAEGVTQLSGMVVSHDDSDHAGGAGSVLGAIGADWMLASLPPSYPLLTPASVRTAPCERGARWLWDGVLFEMLHPVAGKALGGNRNSCVLRVSTGAFSALLAADIDLLAERELKAVGLLLPTDIVVAPHHGSKSASGDEFVAALSPAWVLYAAGYRSRFGHPHEEVVSRYRAAGATALRSDRDGAVRLRVAPSGIAVERWRERARRYWHAESPLPR